MKAVLDEVVASINRTEGAAHQVRLELFAAERPALVPDAGPSGFGDPPTPGDLFVGIVSAALSDRGGDNLIRRACDRWRAIGAPWIKLYFDDDPRVPRKKRETFEEVCRFRNEYEPLGVVSGYSGVRGGENSFHARVSEHLRSTLLLLAPPVPSDASPYDPTKYLRDLLDKSAWIDIRGLQVGTGRANRFPIEELYISLTTTGAPLEPEERRRRSRKERPVVRD